MSVNYVLIDFENVQPKNLSLLKNHNFKVIVFVGANQTKVPFELASAMQSLGESAKYIKIQSSGKNALDFHITYYLGELVSKDPKAFFHIISKDTGFDPLVRHLKSKKIRANRTTDISNLPPLQIPTTTPTDEKIKAIVKNLKGRGPSKPRIVKTLSNSINSLFVDKLSEQQLDNLVKELQKRNYIRINKNNHVTYNLK